MRGSIRWQTDQVYHESGIKRIGESKHQAKEAARKSGAVGWHETGKALGVYSYATADAYRAVWRQLLTHTKEFYGTKDIERLNGEHVASFLSSKIDDGVARATFAQYVAALEKLETSLNMYSDKFNRGRTYDFSPALAKASAEACDLEKFDGSRAYEDPRALISAITNPDFRLAAALQHESGGRVREASLIKKDQLHGIQRDAITGRERGVVEVQAKGGKIVHLKLSPDTYRTLERRISTGDGVFKIVGSSYRRALERAAVATKQDYQGSHGLRWCFAQERMGEVQRAGKCFDEALSIVSSEMGHERADITKHYLR